MTERPDPAASTPMRRLVGLLFGAFFVLIAILIAATSDASNRVPATAAAFVLGGLGLDLIINSLGGKRSLLSRIGPLP